MAETADEEIERLEAERHSYSETFKNTSTTDTVTRAHLQAEMDRRTTRIQELQQHQPLGLLPRWGLRTASLALLWGAWGIGPWWAKLGCVLLAAFLALYSLG
ncbi:hypothetical protein [Streptomyces flavofungini]|uniref:hypothetical protein n=1 Tax=Streptomyces flavofungini TaxID=68200 RepID=UPI0025B262F3|nr:hypothetical protein [Streptomyces flavofungini]WJV51782.1 hypothetical protein QUY26_39850 [Streptomyces flavofungini]